MKERALIEIMKSQEDDRLLVLRYYLDGEFGAWFAYGKPEFVGLMQDDATIARIIALLMESRDEAPSGRECYKPTDAEQSQRRRNYQVVQIAVTDEGMLVAEKLRPKRGGWVGARERDKLRYQRPTDMERIAADLRRLLSAGD